MSGYPFLMAHMLVDLPSAVSGFSEHNEGRGRLIIRFLEVCAMLITPEQIQQFKQDGYFIV